MKFNALAILTCIALGVATAQAAGNHDHAPKFGGVVIETKAGDVEVVAKPDVIQIYVSDHGKEVKLDGAKAKVTLLNGSEKSEADLTPAGNKLEAKGTFKIAKGTKGIAVILLAGKPAATARFEVK
ncbi:MAG: hypothetical protein IPK34_02715 [Ramlibacter sp.]|jgi:hypothetical protein|nr:hypothetical protein [Ramlibacter sp.]